MNSQQFWFLFFLLLPFVVGAFVVYPHYKRAKQDQNRYRFYAFRDELIYLAGKGRLDEKDFLFQEFYGMVNRVVNKTHHLTFKNLILAVGSDLRDEKSIAKIKMEFDKAQPDVKEAIYNYFRAITLALHCNSATFKILFGVFGFSETSKRIFRSLKRLIPSKFLDAYRIEKNLTTFRPAN